VVASESTVATHETDVSGFPELFPRATDRRSFMTTLMFRTILTLGWFFFVSIGRAIDGISGADELLRCWVAWLF